MGKKFLAHITYRDGVRYEQSLRDHCRRSAKYAYDALEAVGLGMCAMLAALVHDMGKACERFMEYLEAAAAEKDVRRGSVNHTFAGVRFLLERYWGPGKPESVRAWTAEILAWVGGSHHGQFDLSDPLGGHGFEHRMTKKDICYEEARDNFLRECADIKELDAMFDAAVGEIERFFKAVSDNIDTAGECDFWAGLLARLVLSAVEEGDRRDTYEFMSGKTQPECDVDNDGWHRLSVQLDEKIDGMECKLEIDRARRDISHRAGEAAQKPGGVYRLNVPTGGGKTLSSLRYAAAHAAIHGKRRLIFAVPLLSILDQNAKAIKGAVGNDGMILEHHSNIIWDEAAPAEELERADLLRQTWDAPIIITTLVQLLNTMFDGGSGAIRRFHSLCESVVIIDEVQTVPTHLLSLFNVGVGFLSAVCGATVVLCSATQPDTENAAHRIAGEAGPLLLYDPDIWKVFKRTVIIDAGSGSADDIVFMAGQIIDKARSLLIVCNTKAEAADIFKKLPDGEYEKFHLSASMCMAHRDHVIKELKARLDPKSKWRGKLVCVSTQVIEAGVDISFAWVIRLAAGMDSVIQTAGRGNRNGELPGGAEVDIVTLLGEDLGRLPDIRRGKEATLRLLADFKRSPGRFDGDLSSDSAIKSYYSMLYKSILGQNSEVQDGPVKVGQRDTTLFEMLSDNMAFRQNDNEKYNMHQAFKTAGERFSVFDRATVDVITGYNLPKTNGEGTPDENHEKNDLIERLCSLDADYDIGYASELIRKAARYTVPLYDYQIKALEQRGGLIPLLGGRAFGLQEGYYDEELGFTMEQGSLEFKEV